MHKLHSSETHPVFLSQLKHYYGFDGEILYFWHAFALPPQTNEIGFEQLIHVVAETEV